MAACLEILADTGYVVLVVVAQVFLFVAVQHLVKGFLRLVDREWYILILCQNTQDAYIPLMGQVRIAATYVHSPTQCLFASLVEQFAARSLAGNECLLLTAAQVGFMRQHVSRFQLSLVIDLSHTIAVTRIDDHCAVGSGCPVVVFVAELFNGERAAVRLCDGDGYMQCGCCLDKKGDEQRSQYNCDSFHHV